MSNPLQPQQFEQLSMFMTGRELMSTHQAGEGDKPPGWSSEETFEDKLHEAERDKFTPKLVAEGVKNPIEVTHELGTEGKKQILDGHHRAAVSNAVMPERYVPVIHHETEVDAVNPKFWQAYPNL